MHLHVFASDILPIRIGIRWVLGDLIIINILSYYFPRSKSTQATIDIDGPLANGARRVGVVMISSLDSVNFVITNYNYRYTYAVCYMPSIAYCYMWLRQFSKY